jgi:hypothetical protein
MGRSRGSQRFIPYQLLASPYKQPSNTHTTRASCFLESGVVTALQGDPALVEPGQNKRDIIAQWSETPAGAAVVPLRDGGVEKSRWGGQRVGCCCSTELSYDAFVSDYMAPNRPVLIKGERRMFRTTHSHGRSAKPLIHRR